MLKLDYTHNIKDVVVKDLPELELWVHRVLGPSSSKISFFTSINSHGLDEIYIKTGHKACTVLLYLVLNHNRMKAALKNPQGPTKKIKINEIIRK